MPIPRHLQALDRIGHPNFDFHFSNLRAPKNRLTIAIRRNFPSHHDRAEYLFPLRTKKYVLISDQNSRDPLAPSRPKLLTSLRLDTVNRRNRPGISVERGLFSREKYSPRRARSRNAPSARGTRPLIPEPGALEPGPCFGSPNFQRAVIRRGASAERKEGHADGHGCEDR